MSSPKATARTKAGSASAAKSATKAGMKAAAGGSDAPAAAASAAAPAVPAASAAASDDATQLAARIERDLRDGRLDTLTPEAFQALMGVLCKSYGAQREAGIDFLPITERTANPTEVMMVTSALLKAANLAVFELGMWQSWTGR
jgi:hypothetical protein